MAANQNSIHRSARSIMLYLLFYWQNVSRVFSNHEIALLLCEVILTRLTFFIGSSILHISLELLMKLWKTSLQVTAAEFKSEGGQLPRSCLTRKFNNPIPCARRSSPRETFSQLVALVALVVNLVKLKISKYGTHKNQQYKLMKSHTNEE